MKNPIPKLDFYATKGIRELCVEIDNIPNTAERQIAMLYALQMMNACNKAVEDQLNDQLTEV
jgi:hypothetical protein